MTYEYTSIFVQPCNGITSCLDVTFTLHRDTQIICNGDFTSYTTADQFGFTTYFSPSNSGYWPYYGTSSYSHPGYNIESIKTGTGPDRNYFNIDIKEAIEALGIANDIANWSLDKAEAIARAMRGDMSKYLPLMSVNQMKISGQLSQVATLAEKFAYVGLIIDGVQLGVGLFDGQLNWEDGKNIIMVGLGVTGLVFGGWVGVGAGVISIVITVATQD